MLFVSPNYSLETHEKVDEFSKLTRKEKPNKEIFKKMKNSRDFLIHILFFLGKEGEFDDFQVW